jgi:hypothetical protein
MEEELRRAIAGLKVIRCTYLDQHRCIHPLAIIIDAAARVLLCWQIGGATSTGRTVPCWGYFMIAGITDLVVEEEETFPGAPAGYDPDHYPRIVCTVPRNPNR